MIRTVLALLSYSGTVVLYSPYQVGKNRANKNWQLNSNLFDGIKPDWVQLLSISIFIYLIYWTQPFGKHRFLLVIQSLPQHLYYRNYHNTRHRDMAPSINYIVKLDQLDNDYVYFIRRFITHWGPSGLKIYLLIFR